MENYSPIVKETLREVNDFLNLNHNSNLVYHNFQHSIALLQHIDAICREEKTIDHSSKEISQLAAIYYNVGFAKNPADPISSAREAAKNELKDETVSTKVQDCLQALAEGAFANTDAEKLIQDALAAHELANETETSNPIQRMEAER